MAHAHAHAPGHAHAHGHGHGHAPAAGSVGRDDVRGLTIALALIAGLMVGELVAGLLASSLALLADAAHMLGDAAALGVSLAAARLVRRPATRTLTFGFGRAEIMSAQANGLLLAVLGLVILGESVARLTAPAHPDATVMVVVALVGVAVNLLAVRALTPAADGQRSLNVEGSFRHVLTDLYGFAATALAGLVILVWGFDRADPLASLVVTLLMLHAAWGLLKQSGRIFMEAAPAGLDAEEVGMTMAALEGVVEVHDLHVWEVTSGFPALSAHVVVRSGEDCHALRRRVQRLLEERFDLHHTTLQVDHEGAPQPPIQIELGGRSGR